MRIGRTIVAVLVALSVATLPAATGFAAGVPSAAEMSTSQTMPDCEHHRHNAPDHKTQKDHGRFRVHGCLRAPLLQFHSNRFLRLRFFVASQCRAQARSHEQQYFLAHGQSALPTSSRLTPLKLPSNARAASSRAYSVTAR